MQTIVVGGGFGGVKAALELSKNKKMQVTLISDRPDFQYYPALYSTATGGSHLQSWVPLGVIFAGRDNVRIIIDSLTNIDKESRTITMASGTKHEYHKLVLALGSVTTYFGIPGLDEYAYGIKSHDEIERLKQHLLREFSTAHAADSHFLIVGAGPTGVELASSLGTYLKKLKKEYKKPQARISISIIEAAPRVLPRMSEKASKMVEQRLKKLGVHVELNKKVESETADSLIVSGRPIKSHTVIWTSGVANNPFFKANESQFKLAPNGRVLVDKHMRADKHVYVIGDNAVTPFGGLAQTALHDAIYVAKQILGKSHKKYKAKQPPVVVPIGENWAIFEYKKLRFGGWLGSLVRTAADFVGYSDILRFGQALGVWRAQKVKEKELYLASYDKAAPDAE
jgi:NADH dehydrogenase